MMRMQNQTVDELVPFKFNQIKSHVPSAKIFSLFFITFSTLESYKLILKIN